MKVSVTHFRHRQSAASERLITCTWACRGVHACNVVKLSSGLWSGPGTLKTRNQKTQLKVERSGTYYTMYAHCRIVATCANGGPEAAAAKVVCVCVCVCVTCAQTRTRICGQSRTTRVYIVCWGIDGFLRVLFVCAPRNRNNRSRVAAAAAAVQM